MYYITVIFKLLIPAHSEFNEQIPSNHCLANFENEEFDHTLINAKGVGVRIWYKLY